MTSSRLTDAPGPWPFRLALATCLAAIPLLVFGGMVTTTQSGMAIDGWLTLEPGRGDHFLLFYPLEKWFRDQGTFLEHTHRLFGVLVGLFSIATVVASWRQRPTQSAGLAAFIGLALVGVQGWVGGSRVLEASPSLAFLHGALAQIVFAYLAWLAAYLSPRRVVAQEIEDDASAALRRGSRLALIVTYVAIFSGAWLRHAFSHMALGVHILLVFAALAVVFAFVGKAKRQAEGDPRRRPLRMVGLRLHILVGLQLLLGLASFWIVVMVAPKDDPDVHHSLYPTLHVLFGALVLSQLAAGTLWTTRVDPPAASPESSP